MTESDVPSGFSSAAIPIPLLVNMWTPSRSRPRIRNLSQAAVVVRRRSGAIVAILTVLFGIMLAFFYAADPKQVWVRPAFGCVICLIFVGIVFAIRGRQAVVDGPFLYMRNSVRWLGPVDLRESKLIQFRHSRLGLGVAPYGLRPQAQEFNVFQTKVGSKVRAALLHRLSQKQIPEGALSGIRKLECGDVDNPEFWRQISQYLFSSDVVWLGGSKQDLTNYLSWLEQNANVHSDRNILRRVFRNLI